MDLNHAIISSEDILKSEYDRENFVDWLLYGYTGGKYTIDKHFIRHQMRKIWPMEEE